jgi:hypothetical protein
LIFIFVKTYEKPVCDEAGQLAVIDKRNFVDSFRLLVTTLLKVLENIFEVGNAHLIPKLVALVWLLE